MAGIRTPTTPRVNGEFPRHFPLPDKSKSRLTLREAWKTAEEQFYYDTDGKRLGDLKEKTKNGVLQMWNDKYKTDEDANHKKHQAIASILTDVLNGVELVGAFAAQAASTVFAPAGMCFNAISFLIDAPRQIHKVYDTLQDLFFYVKSFLVKFNIYQRIDDNFGLDDDLVANTNTLLISFVKICGLATKLLDGGRLRSLKTAFDAVFLRKDSGVSAELANFQRLTEDQSTLTGTITLEVAMRSESIQKQILTDSKRLLEETGEIKGGVNTLISRSNDEKTKAVNRERLAAIEARLFKGGLPDGVASLPHGQQNKLINGTLDKLESTSEFKEWNDTSKRTTSMLALYGPRGSGKSRVVHALKAKVDAARERAERDDRSTYVAIYDFGGKKQPTTSSLKESKSSIPEALKVMALHTAKQSTTYAARLQAQLYELKNLDEETEIEKLWVNLKLSSFQAPPNAILYLLFDSINEDSEAKRLISVLHKEKMNEQGSSLCVKVLFTVDEQAPDVYNALPNISWSSLNRDLLVTFAANELTKHNIFQGRDKRSVKFKEDTLKKILVGQYYDADADGAIDHGSFVIVSQRINNLRIAIENDASDNDLDRILQEEGDADTVEKGEEELDRLAASLSRQNINLLNRIITWILCTPHSLDLEELEAALYLEQGQRPLEPLRWKIEERFNSVIDLWGDSNFVAVSWLVQDALRKRSRSPTEQKQNSDTQPLVTLNLCIEKATKHEVRKFIWQLNEQMSNGTFDFKMTEVTDNDQRLHFDEFDGTLKILRLMFSLLESGWDESTAVLVSYACQNIPSLLDRITEDDFIGRVSFEDRKMIGRGLMTFLTDQYHFERNHESHGNGSWLIRGTSGLKYWLNDVDVVEQLPARDRRWLKDVMSSDQDSLGFLRDLAKSIALRWLNDYTRKSYQHINWLANYLYVPSEPDLPPYDPSAYAPTNVGTSAPTSPVHEAALEPSTESPTIPTIDVSSEPTTTDQPAVSTDHSNDILSQSPVQSSLQEPLDLPKISIDTTESLAASKNGVTDDSQVESPSDPKEANAEQEEGIDKAADQNAQMEALVEDVQSGGSSEIEKALAWAKDNCVIEINPSYWVSLGDTYYDRDYFDKAVNCYEQAAQDEELRPHALVGLARCHHFLDKKELAEQYADQALDIFFDLSDKKLLDDICLKELPDIFDFMSGMYEGMKKPEKALEIRERLLDQEPNIEGHYWDVMRLRCMIDHKQQSAIETIDRWYANCGSFGGKGPALHISSLIQLSGWGSDASSICRAVKNEDLRRRLMAVLDDGIRVADLDLQSALLYCKAILCILAPDQSLKAKAITYWEQVLMVPTASIDHFLKRVLQVTAQNIAKYKFDELREEFLGNNHITVDDKIVLQKRFKEYLDRRVRISSNTDWATDYNQAVWGYDQGDVDNWQTFEIALCVLLGMREEARKRTAPDMGRALEILTDSDPDNDSAGFRLLARVLAVTGDVRGALTVVSLLDRDIQLRRLQEGESFDLSSISTDEKLRQGIAGQCIVCSTDIFSSDKDGIWWCSYCPDSEYCRTCKDQLAAGTVQDESCSTKHVPNFVHLVHTTYTEEELEAGKVRIDWTHEPDGDIFKRVGGRMIDLSDWLEQLRVEWDLPKSEGDASRAQK